MKPPTSQNFPAGWVLPILLALSVAVNLYLLFRPDGEDFESIYPLLSPTLRDSPPLKKGKIRSRITLRPLQEKIARIIEDAGRASHTDPAYPPKISVYIEDLNTGAWLGVEERLRYYPLSLVKVPAAIAAMRKVDIGEWTLETTFQLRAADPDTYSGPLGEVLREGDQITLGYILENLMVESDNTVFRVIYRSLTPEELDDVHYHLGLAFTPATEGKAIISPKNYATIFRSLYFSSYLRLSSAQYLLSLMTRVPRQEALRAAVPSHITVSRKEGWSHPADRTGPQISFFKHESGIVYYPGSPLLISIMTVNMKDWNSAAQTIEAIARAAYEFYERTEVEQR